MNHSSAQEVGVGATYKKKGRRLGGVKEVSNCQFQTKDWSGKELDE